MRMRVAHASGVANASGRGYVCWALYSSTVQDREERFSVAQVLYDQSIIH